MDNTNDGRGWRRWAPKAAIAAGGLLVGGLLAGTLTASAADTTASTAGQSAASGQRAGGTVDESKSQRPDERLLTGDTASKVRAAALAKYPGATVLRVETTDGQRVTVEVDKAFKVTGEEAGHRR